MNQELIELRRGKHVCRINIEIAHRVEVRRTIDLEAIKEYMELSVTAEIMSGQHSIIAGQCVDKIEDLFGDVVAIRQLCQIWRRWHLNGMRAGTRAQMKAISDRGQLGYDETLVFLETLKLVSDRGYRYGSEWLVEFIPDDVVTELKSIIKVLRAAGSVADLPMVTT